MPREFRSLRKIGSSSALWQCLPNAIEGIGELPVLRDPLLLQRIRRYPLHYQFSTKDMYFDKRDASRITAAFDWLSEIHTGAWLWREHPSHCHERPAFVDVFIEREPDRLKFEQKYGRYFRRDVIAGSAFTSMSGAYSLPARPRRGNALHQAIVMRAVKEYTADESFRVWCEEKSGFQLEILGPRGVSAQMFVRGLTPGHQERLYGLMKRHTPKHFRFNDELGGFVGPLNAGLERSVRHEMDLTIYPVRSLRRITFSGKINGIVVLRRPQLIEEFATNWRSICVAEPFERWRLIDAQYKDVLTNQGARGRHPSKRALSPVYRNYVSGKTDIRPIAAGG